MISDVKQEKRMDWCLHQVLSGDLEFKWTDECSVQLESHRKIMYRKEGQPMKMHGQPAEAPPPPPP